MKEKMREEKKSNSEKTKTKKRGGKKLIKIFNDYKVF